ncbi:MAG: glycosyltransferase family 4 protein [Chitinophagaceae bacterium]|nr:glycosyltransferase family 4 protein [Oligoflexus sp.]
MGAEVRLFSTQKPPLAISSHSWSDAAKKRTIYLIASTKPSLFLGLLVSVSKWPPSAWYRCLQSVLAAKVSFGEKINLCFLAVFGARMARLAHEQKLDHIHVHSCANAANIALFAHILSGITYSLTLHGPLSDYGFNQEQKWEGALFKIIITQKLLGEVRATLGSVITRNSYIAPMGVNISVFKRGIPYKAWLIESGPAQLYSVGRLHVGKGHADLIQAVRHLKGKGLSIRLRIAGEDEQGGSGYHLELAQLIEKLDLRNEVELLGAVSETVVREGLIASHAFVLASKAEPLGVAIMEAMALEMPVIVTSGGGVKELVNDGSDGILVPPENSMALAEAIEGLLRNPDLAVRLSKASRQKIEEQFQDHRSAELMLRMAHG